MFALEENLDTVTQIMAVLNKTGRKGKRSLQKVHDCQGEVISSNRFVTTVRFLPCLSPKCKMGVCKLFLSDISSIQIRNLIQLKRKDYVSFNDVYNTWVCLLVKHFKVTKVQFSVFSLT